MKQCTSVLNFDSQMVSNALKEKVPHYLILISLETETRIPEHKSLNVCGFYRT